ncbi:unnamed protein product, partial [Brassica rapa]
MQKRALRCYGEEISEIERERARLYTNLSINKLSSLHQPKTQINIWEERELEMERSRDGGSTKRWRDREMEEARVRKMERSRDGGSTSEMEIEK